MKLKKTLPLAARASLSLVLAGCSGAGTGASASSTGIQVPDLPMATEVGASEGEVNIVAWAGFVEDGSTNPDADWVSAFEEQTQSSPPPATRRCA
jgi:putative spermidine/putrescine transport system substrate-binding protein